MADRKLPTSLSTGPVTGPDYMDAVAAKMGMLFDTMALKPTSVVNSGNDYTITVDPMLDADVVAGMGFFIQPNATNTGPSRLRVGATNPYYDLVKAGGEALSAGEFSASTAYFVVFLGGEFRILSVANNESGGGANIDFQQFDVSGNWTKPDGLSAEAFLIVEVWGGGGGGVSNISGSYGGGGGGAYNLAVLRAADVTSIVSVTVGAGGAINTAGGASSFGSYVAAYGGGGGGATGTAGGGGGGGASSAGGGGPSGNGGLPDNGAARNGSGSPGTGYYGGGGGSIFGGAALYGGGGGSSSSPGSSMYGGGGGGGTSGGVSIYGGNGGTNTSPNGVAPGGGGARGGSGGAGRVRVRVIG